jgi:hypothetical protein
MFDDLFVDENFVPSDVLAALVLIYTHEGSKREKMKVLEQQGESHHFVCIISNFFFKYPFAKGKQYEKLLCYPCHFFS